MARVSRWMAVIQHVKNVMCRVGLAQKREVISLPFLWPPVSTSIVSSGLPDILWLAIFSCKAATLRGEFPFMVEIPVSKRDTQE